MDSEEMSDRIKRARVACGISQESLGRALGVSRATVAHWERRAGFLPSTRRLGDISQILNVSVEWLTLGDAVENQRHAAAGFAFRRRDLEDRMIAISRNIPSSMLLVFVTLLESFGEYLS
ncbi:helix-turn-helix transcriptional regulator [Xanthomonas translucens pv. translucens]|nr:helix-turn-helix transcriptional regulator [Xanthomonas translucens pv. translucens]